MEFDPTIRRYDPTKQDRDFIGQHQSVYEHDTYQMGRLVERNLDAIRLGGGNPLSTPATRLADANLGLICLNSGPNAILRHI